MRSKALGQALVEYMFVLLFMSFLAVKTIGAFTDFFRDSLGNLGHVLSVDLSSGTCPSECYFDSYANELSK